MPNLNIKQVPALADITFIKGDELNIIINIIENSLPKDITGYSFSGEIKIDEFLSIPIQVNINDYTNGIISLNIQEDTSKTILNGSYNWQLKMVYNGITKTIISGKINIIKPEEVSTTPTLTTITLNYIENNLILDLAIAGIKGDSAYQTWLNEGNTGTETDFLVTLQGQTGVQGATGPVGATGPQASNQSKILMVKDNDFITTEQTLQDIDGLITALEKNKKYKLEATLFCETSDDSDGVVFGFSYTGSSATIKTSILGEKDNNTMGLIIKQEFNTATDSFLNSNNQKSPILIAGTISTSGLNSGNFSIQCAKLVSGLAKVYIGSNLTITEIV